MKKFISGVVLGGILATSITVYGEEVKNLVGQAIQGTFPVKMDGEVLKNEAVVLDGTSYLPVREIGEKLGMEVKFTPETGIELNRPEPKLDDTGMPIGFWTKERLESAIESQKSLIRTRETQLKLFSDAGPEGVAQMQKLLKEAQDKLADLEKQKAELLK
jgi:hypothetical protein